MDFEAWTGPRNLEVFLRCFDSNGTWYPTAEATRPRNITVVRHPRVSRPTLPVRPPVASAQIDPVSRPTLPGRPLVVSAQNVTRSRQHGHHFDLQMSDFYVPLIYAALQQHDPTYSPCTQTLREWYGNAEWNYLVACYQEDFEHRSISGSSFHGYIEAGIQERLLYPFALPPGESGIELSFFWTFQEHLSVRVVASGGIP